MVAFLAYRLSVTLRQQLRAKPVTAGNHLPTRTDCTTVPAYPLGPLPASRSEDSHFDTE